jgi:hypothetical protein
MKKTNQVSGTKNTAELFKKQVSRQEIKGNSSSPLTSETEPLIQPTLAQKEDTRASSSIVLTPSYKRSIVDSDDDEESIASHSQAGKSKARAEEAAVDDATVADNGGPSHQRVAEGDLNVTSDTSPATPGSTASSKQGTPSSSRKKPKLTTTPNKRGANRKLTFLTTLAAPTPSAAVKTQKSTRRNLPKPKATTNQNKDTFYQNYKKNNEFATALAYLKGDTGEIKKVTAHSPKINIFKKA